MFDTQTPPRLNQQEAHGRRVREDNLTRFDGGLSFQGRLYVKRNKDDADAVVEQAACPVSPSVSKSSPESRGSTGAPVSSF